MVGGASRRDDGPVGINSTNVFAALESLRRKKKSDKEHGSSKNKGSSKSQAKEPEPQVFWQPTPLTVKSWADVDDDDDDDYYATTAPPQSVWATSEPQQNKEISTLVEETESEEDGLDDGEDDVEDEHEHEHEPEVLVQPEPVENKLPQASLPPKDTERQLSKKELKKKELAELEAVLAELGMNNKAAPCADESHGAAQEQKTEVLNGDVEKESAPSESKSAKKKKKKDKSSKEVKEQQDHTNGSEVNHGLDETAGTENADEDASAIDVKERLKKMASMKKKKSSKELDAAAKAAAVEAAARSAKLAAAKKKEKNHYNQQPVR